MQGGGEAPGRHDGAGEAAGGRCASIVQGCCQDMPGVRGGRGRCGALEWCVPYCSCGGAKQSTRPPPTAALRGGWPSPWKTRTRRAGAWMPAVEAAAQKAARPGHSSHIQSRSIMKLCRCSSVAPRSSSAESSAARPTVSACAAGLAPHRGSSVSSRQAGAAAVAAVAALAAAAAVAALAAVAAIAALSAAAAVVAVAAVALAEAAEAAAPSATSVRLRFAGAPPTSAADDGPGAREAS